ncbi:MAG TPA: DUF4895 domain-containing protein [Fervidobacterium sp.]|jgi:hypothetical protein|nr:DUF4895 domain-containing protein [Fervidobacterium sp.]HPC79789.1 DUF4895 domain-containing protein [Fervidobacterium sp.]HPV62633.1 DUF4895 domain-containing protein [Fervidobacterium sp.]HRT01121.1 DUF4895 domain-containing protein [Fervidobacterium sp.]HRV37211.1 DUF4895 domain-containing protein [Fervidobacterium sp.]
MYIGPEKYRIMETLDFDSSELIAFLENKKERLDVYHRHVAVVTCYGNYSQSTYIDSSSSGKEKRSNNFYLNFIVTPSNEKLVGLSISQPMLKSPAIYKLQDLKSAGQFSDTYYRLFAETCALQCGIIKLPMKTRFIAINGDESFLNKEIYREKVMNTESFSFAQRVNDAILERLEKYKDGTFDMCRVIINDEGINFFVVDKSLRDDHVPLYSEVISLLRKKYALTPARFFPVNEKVIGSFVLGFDSIFSDELFTQVSKLLREYSMIKENLSKYI